MKFAYLGLVASIAFASGAGALPSSPVYKVTAQIAGADGGWDFASVDPVAHRLYIARTAGVMAVDLASGAVTPLLNSGQRGHAAFVIPGTHDVIATYGVTDTAVLFDGLTGAVKATTTTGKKPDAVVYDPATKSLWVMDAGSGDISVVEPATGKLLATVPVGGSLELGAADGAGMLYVNIEDRNEVAVIDTRARKVVRRFPLKGCDGPTGLAYVPDHRFILSACANGVTKVSRTDGSEVASLATGKSPDGALYDERRHLAFVPSGGDGTLAVIELSPTPKIVARVATAKGARTAALDPVSGRIYLPSVQYLPAVGTARPQPVPGSFSVIVVSPVGDAR